MNRITIVGGGIAGLTAAITAAEGGAPVRLLEAHDSLGGRARSMAGPYKANFGPHVIYKDGAALVLVGRARTAAALLRPAAGRHPLPLAGRDPPHAAAGDDPGSAAPARSRSAGRPGLPQLGRQPLRRAHRGDALRRRRRLHLPPRPRRALRRLRLEALGARPAQPAADGALPARWLELADRGAGGAGAPPRGRDRDRARGRGAAELADDRRHRAGPGARAARRRAR